MERVDRPTRRQLVALVAAVSVPAFGGCAGPGDGGNETEGDEEAPQGPVTETATEREPDEPPPNESEGGHPNDLENQTPGYERGNRTDAETADETTGDGNDSADDA